MNASKRSSRRWARASAACLRSALVLLLAVALPAAAAGEIYRWKDANGQWHYSDTPPRDREAEQVGVAPPPKPEPGTSTTGGEVMPDTWAMMAKERQVGGVEPRSVRDVQRGCATIVNACATPGGPDRASCLASVRQCAADPTMERQDCCPAACSLRYAELRSQGLPEGLAFTRAVYGTPSCVPGADAEPVPDSQPSN